MAGGTAAPPEDRLCSPMLACAPLAVPPVVAILILLSRRLVGGTIHGALKG